MQTRKLTEVPISELSKETNFVVEIDEEMKRVRSSDIRQLVTDEKNRAQEAEKNLADRIDEETTRAVKSEKTLTDNLASEVTRAKAEEKTLATDLGVESSRAQAAEKVLTDNLFAEAARAKAAEKTLADSLAVETTRAKGAEKANADNLAAEVIRAKAGEKAVADNLTVETARAKTREDGIAADLAAENNRALNAENALDGDLAVETIRAKAAEKTLTDNLAAEIARAEEKETEISENLSSEITRAKATEKTLADNITAEVTRAKGAEKTLTDNLAAEVTRSKGAEKTLTDNLATEVTRAKDAEKTNADAITAEASRGQAAEDAIRDTVNAHLNNKSNPHGVTKAQTGLGNVPNVSTNDQTPTFTQAATLANIASGEKLTVMLGKIAKALADFIAHKADTVIHVTGTERTNWNDANSKKHTHANKSIIDKLTQAMLDKLAGIATGAEVNVQSDWNATDSASDAFIKNKPTSMTAKGGESDTAVKLKTARTINGIAFDGSKNITIDANTPIKQLTSGSLDDVKTFGDYYAAGGNTVTGLPEAVTSFGLCVSKVAAGIIEQEFNYGNRKWTRIFNSSTNTWGSWVEFYSEGHKPAWSDVTGKPSTFVPAVHSHTKSQISDFPSSMPASDVAAWAKATTKPSYGWTEITGKPSTFAPSTHNHTKSQITDMPTKVSQFTNDKGYITAADIDTSQNHVHANKSVLDKITQALMDNWNAAHTHVSDTIKHITAAERSNWNAVTNKVDKVTGKGLSTNDYTTAEKNKLASIVIGAKQLVDVDLNTLYKIDHQGIYYGGGGNTCTNKPSGIDSFGLNIYRIASGCVAQEIISLESNNVTYFRTYYNSWSTWIKIYSTSNKPTPAELGAAPSVHTHTKSQITDFPTSLPANGGNSTTVNGHTVNADVPSGAKFTDTVYTHSTTSGNKHIPAGGASGQFLKWSAAGTAVWAADNNTTYAAFKAATASAAGGTGLVPAPAAGAQAKYLRADGNWQTPLNTTYGVATQTANGLMSMADKKKSDRRGTVTILPIDEVSWKPGLGGSSSCSYPAAMAGITSSDNILVALDLPNNLSEEEESKRKEAFSYVSNVVTTNGMVTLYCNSKRPQCSFEIAVTIL